MPPSGQRRFPLEANLHKLPEISAMSSCRLWTDRRQQTKRPSSPLSTADTTNVRTCAAVELPKKRLLQTLKKLVSVWGTVFTVRLADKEETAITPNDDDDENDVVKLHL